MKALVTGASSGIGREMAIYLGELGCDLILVDKDKKGLEEVSNSIKTKVNLIVIDLSNEKRMVELYMITKNSNVDFLVNNAGYGLFGDYNSVNIKDELNMIELNVKAVHFLTRMFLKDMVKKDKGYILNVASSAGLLRGGPLMSTYYATKGYVVDFTLGISEELRRNKSKVRVGVLCPGPVTTNFNKVAGVKFNISSLDAKYVARYAIDSFIRDKKLVIVPGFKVKMGVFFSRFVSMKRLLKITYNIQRKKK